MAENQKRYCVAFYDFIDGWGTFGFFTDRLFDDLELAKTCCDRLNTELPRGNKDCGEYYAVIDGETDRVVFWGSNV